MPVHNVIDHRVEEKRHNVRAMVIFEDSWHDNVIRGATQFPTKDVHGNPIDKVHYRCIRQTTIYEAIEYARQEWPDHAVTLFLYDTDVDNYVDYETIVMKDGRWVCVEK